MIPFVSFRTVSYSHYIVIMAVPIAVSTQYADVTDTGHTVTRTPHDSIGRAYAYAYIARQKVFYSDREPDHPQHLIVSCSKVLPGFEMP